MTFDPSDIRMPMGRPPTYNYSEEEELPNFIKVMLGTWNVVYSWPPLETLRKSADHVTFMAPSKLETAVFSCRCRPDNSECLAPIKMEDSAAKQRVYATQMVSAEKDVLTALGKDTCGCRDLPLATKFVLYPLDASFVLKYIKLPKFEYNTKNPCHVYLLHRELPPLGEIKKMVKDLELNKRKGASTYFRDEGGSSSAADAE